MASTMMSNLAVNGGSTCRLSPGSPMTGLSLAPSPAPPQHNIVISVDLLEELAMISPSPTHRSNTLFDTIGIPEGQIYGKYGTGYSRALQRRMLTGAPRHKDSFRDKLRLLDDNIQRRGHLSSIKTSSSSRDSVQGSRKVFCVTGTKNACTLQEEKCSPEPQPQPLHIIRPELQHMATRRFHAKDATASSLSACTGPYNTTTGHASPSSRHTSSSRKERLCNRGPQVRDISGFETVSCKLHEKYIPENQQLYQFVSSIHPINRRESDQGSIEGQPDDVIRIPTGMGEARHRSHMVQYSSSGGRTGVYGPGRSGETCGRRKKSPAPPRGFPASQKFMMTWLDAGCGRTTFSESLKEDSRVLKRKNNTNVNNDAFFKWAHSANRIRLMPQRILQKIGTNKIPKNEDENQNNEAEG